MLITAQIVHAINIAHGRIDRMEQELLLEYHPIMVNAMIKQLQDKETAVLDALEDLLRKYGEVDQLACAAADHPNLNHLLDQLNIDHGNSDV